MRKALVSLVVGACAVVLLGGCTMVTPVNGSLYTAVTGPVAVGNATGSDKMGEATSTGILGFATGDSSIEKAMQNGGITKVHHVDCKVQNILGIYAKYTTVVYGE